MENKSELIVKRKHKIKNKLYQMGFEPFLAFTSIQWIIKVRLVLTFRSPAVDSKPCHINKGSNFYGCGK